MVNVSHKTVGEAIDDSSKTRCQKGKSYHRGIMKPYDIQYRKEIPNICDWIFNFLFFVMVLILLWMGFGIQMAYDAKQQSDAYQKSGLIIDKDAANKKDVQNYRKGK